MVGGIVTVAIDDDYSLNNYRFVIKCIGKSEIYNIGYSQRT
jgi:hypothetical protein